MPEYLSKEEIRKWRSSLERITLEEYAARLGKVIQEEKHDDSLVDSVILKSLNTMTTENYAPVAERIGALSLKAFQKEKELKTKKEAETTSETKKKPVEAKIKEETLQVSEQTKQTKKHAETKSNTQEIKSAKTEIKQENVKSVKTEKAAEKTKETKKSSKTKEVEFSFKKALTAREQTVFEHFYENRNTVVYASDLATILDLPRDYVYKYIKNLRSKLNEDILQNASNGGYMLKV